MDPYFHIRNASEHGALSVLKVMLKYQDNLGVLGVGLQRMAGSLVEGKKWDLAFLPSAKLSDSFAGWSDLE